MPFAATEPAVGGAVGLRFLLFGLFNTGLSYAVYCLLVLALPPQPAYALAYALGIGLAWLGNTLWVFRGNLRWRSALLYPLLYLLQYLIGAGLLALAIRWFELGPRVALALVMALLAPLSFVCNRLLLVPRPEPQP